MDKLFGMKLLEVLPGLLSSSLQSLLGLDLFVTQELLIPTYGGLKPLMTIALIAFIFLHVFLKSRAAAVEVYLG